MRTPAVFPALSVIAGVAFGVVQPDTRSTAAWWLVVMLAIAALAWRARRERLLATGLLAGFTAAGVIFGGVAAREAERPPLREFFDEYTSQPSVTWPLVIEGVLRSDATLSEYGASFVIDVERVRTPCGWLPAAGGARLGVSGALAAQAIDSWREGRRVRLPATLRLPTVYRNPGVPDEQFALARRGIALVGSVKSATLIETMARGRIAQEAAAAIRAYVRETIRRAIPDRPRAAAIVTAILIGDRGGLDPRTTRRLQEAGTYHVIAISGGNIVILAGLSWLLLRLAGAPHRPASVVLALVLCAYAYVAGGGPSVARATMAAAVYLIAVAADHRSPSANVLATVALIAVVYEPLEVFDPGLVLSYGATLGLLVGAERVLRRRRIGDAADGAGDAERAAPDRLRGLARLRPLGASTFVAAQGILLGTVCAELALFPVGAYVFNRVTLAGVLLNFAAIPLMTVAQLAGLATLIVAPVSDPLTRGVGTVAGFAAHGLTESTRVLDLAPWLAWRVPSPLATVIIVYYAGCAGSLWLRCKTPRRIGLACAALGALIITIPALAHATRSTKTAHDQLRLTFLDVGQGDAVLVQFPGGRALLIDAAGLPSSSFDLGERVIVPALLARGVQRLDYLAITHADPDHVVGAPSVARNFFPYELWEGIPVPPHPILNEVQAIVSGTGGATRLVRPNDRLRVNGVELRVLHPSEPDWERQRVRNDDSVVVDLRYGDVSIVLPGDISAAIEEAVVPALSDAPLRVLKAAHHGSATSTSAAWLAATRPAAVIFSCGRDNRYGHPHPAVLERVTAMGAEVFRTDEDGAVTLITDGKTVEVSTFTGRVSRITTKATKGTKEDTNE